MPSQGPNSAATVTETDAGTAWTNPNNIKVSDNARATVGLVGGNSKKLRGVDLGFNIPLTATITGIEGTVEGSSNGGIFTLGLLTNSSEQGTDTIPLTGTEAAHTVGSPTQILGDSVAPTPAEANDQPNFGFFARATTAGMNSFSIDHITLTIYYTDGQPASQSRSMTGVGQ